MEPKAPKLWLVMMAVGVALCIVGMVFNAPLWLKIPFGTITIFAAIKCERWRNAYDQWYKGRFRDR